MHQYFDWASGLSRAWSRYVNPCLLRHLHNHRTCAEKFLVFTCEDRAAEIERHRVNNHRYSIMQHGT